MKTVKDSPQTTGLDKSFRQISFQRDFISHVKLFFDYYVHLDTDQFDIRPPRNAVEKSLKQQIQPRVMFLNQQRNRQTTPLEDLSIVSVNGQLHNKFGHFLWRLMRSYFPDLQYISQEEANTSVTRATFILHLVRAAFLHKNQLETTEDSLFGFGDFNLTRFIEQEGYDGTVLKSDASDLSEIFQNCDETEIALHAVTAFFNGICANGQSQILKSILTSVSRMLRNYQTQQERSVDDLSHQLEQMTIRSVEGSTNLMPVFIRAVYFKPKIFLFNE